MQPLARGTPGSDGTRGQAGREQQQLAAAGPGSRGGGGTTPEVLSWTPMRSSVLTLAGHSGGGGLKRQRDASGSPAEGRVSLVGSGLAGAQQGEEPGRQVRRRMQPGGGGSVERRTWQAGRTPFLQKARPALGAPGAADPRASPAAAVEGGSKLTTDIARRILMTLDTLDQVPGMPSHSWRSCHPS